MATPGQRLSFQGRRLAVEHEDGPDPVEQELADPVEETQQVGVGDRIATAVAKPFHSLKSDFKVV